MLTLFRSSMLFRIAIAMILLILSVATVYSILLLIDNDRVESGRHAWTIDSARWFVHTEPLNPTAHAALGGALLDRMQYAQAIMEFREAVHLNPNDAALHYYLGEALFKNNQRIEARKELETTCQLDKLVGWPSEEAHELLQKL